MSGPRTVGVSSAPHGLLTSEAIAVLSGCELIVHACDIGDERVLAALREIAPTFAVPGNNARGVWAEALPIREAVEGERVAPEIVGLAIRL